MLQVKRHNPIGLLTTGVSKARWLTAGLAKKTCEITRRTQTIGKVTKTLWAQPQSADRQRPDVSNLVAGSKANKNKKLNASNLDSASQATTAKQKTSVLAGTLAVLNLALAVFWISQKTTS